MEIFLSKKVKRMQTNREQLMHQEEKLDIIPPVKLQNKLFHLKIIFRVKINYETNHLDWYKSKIEIQNV